MKNLAIVTIFLFVILYLVQCRPPFEPIDLDKNYPFNASTTGNSYFYVKIADPSTLAISIKITEDTRCVPDGKLRVRTTEPELIDIEPMWFGESCLAITKTDQPPFTAPAVYHISFSSPKDAELMILVEPKTPEPW